MATGKKPAKAKAPPKTAPKKAAPPAARAAAKPAAQAPTKSAPKAPPKTGGKTALLPHMDNKTLHRIIAKLAEMRDESLQVVNTQVQADLRQREDGGEVGDDMDQASNERDREFSLIIHQRHLRRLQQITDAFERIEAKTYGLCEGTEEPINPKRLLIMPLARYSLEFQQQQEKMHGRSPDQGPDIYEDSMMGDE